jgi:hypothetical protein
LRSLVSRPWIQYGRHYGSWKSQQKWKNLVGEHFMG